MSMFSAKYVVFEENGIEDMIIFSSLQQHVDVVSSGDLNPVSAGRIDHGLHCSGDSLSLGLESRPEEDREIARRMFNVDQD